MINVFVGVTEPLPVPVAVRKNDLVGVTEPLPVPVAVRKNDLVGVTDPLPVPVAVRKNDLVGVIVPETDPVEVREPILLAEAVLADVALLRYDFVALTVTVAEVVVTELDDPVVEEVGKGEVLIRKDLLAVSEPVLEGLVVIVPAFVWLFVLDVVPVAVTEINPTSVGLPVVDTLTEGRPETVAVKLLRELPVGAEVAWADEVLTALPVCIEEPDPNALAVADVDTLFREVPEGAGLTVASPLNVDTLEALELAEPVSEGAEVPRLVPLIVDTPEPVGTADTLFRGLPVPRPLIVDTLEGVADAESVTDGLLLPV